MANAEGYVVPKPGVPKTLGILNIIFSVLGLLMGVCGLGIMLLLPAGLQMVEKTAKEAQERVEAQEKAQVKAIDDRIAAAKTDEEKKAIEQEKANAVANQPKGNPVDMSAATDLLKNPTILTYTYVSYAFIIALSVVGLVSGIGLVRLTPWGRSLGVWWAVLGIVFILGSLAANLILVIPIQREANAKQIAKLEEAAKAPGAGQGEASAVQLTKTLSDMAVPLTVIQTIPWSIYPIVLLILLNTKGAKAACMPKRIESIDDL